MSVIYELKFKNGDRYIGSTIEPNKRKSRHYRDLVSGIHHNKDCQKLFEEFGLPEFNIIEDVPHTDLNNKEIWYITNTSCINKAIPGTSGGTSLTGESNGRSKYSNSQIEELFFLVLSGISIKEAASISNVGYSMARQVVSGTAHLWLKEMFPDAYKLLPRRSQNTYTVVSPDNKVYTIINQSEFCKTHNLNKANFNKMLLQKVKTAKGWTLQT